MGSVETKLQFAPADYWVPLLAVLILLAVLWQFVSLRSRFSWQRALGLTAVRFMVLGAVLFFVLEPALLRQRREKYKPTLAVAIDNSQSMGLKGGREETRLERIKAFLSSSVFRDVAEGYFTEYYIFSEGAQPLHQDDIEKVEATGRWTDLEGSLKSIQERATASVGALMVLTDGGHDEDYGERRPGLPGEGETPVLFLAVGGDENPRDIELDSVRSAGLAFAGRPTKFTVTARQQGFPGRTVPLLLKEEDRVVLSRDITFTGAGEDVTVDVAWTPPRPGRYHLSFEVPPQAGEQIRENNRADLTVEAARDKIRVLLVSGRPSWSHRFLRDALKGDPSIDLVSFIILRTAYDAVNVSQDDLSLIPFPTKKIFLEELRNFDLVVFENFSHRFYFPSQYLEKVREFVAGGGGFWMLGGPLSFSAGDYSGTPIEEVLPLSLKNPQSGVEYVAEPFRPRLTPSAAEHPFFLGLGEAEQEELPLLDGYNVSGPARGESVVLADYVDSEGANQPIIVLGRYGKGRVLTVLTDFLWKWNFEMAGRGRGNLLYLSFVRQAIRWSVGDPQYQPVLVHIESDRLVPGQKLRAEIRVRGEDFLPAGEPEMDVILRDGVREIRIPPVKTEVPGLFSIETDVPEAGTYELEARVRRGGAVYGTHSSDFKVAWPVEEFRSPGLNREALAVLAGREGSIIELSAPEETARRLGDALTEAAPVYRIEFEEKKGIGSEWWAFALMVTLLGTEWALRKRQGMD